MATAWAVLPSAAGPWVTFVEAQTSSLGVNELLLHGVYSCGRSFCLPAPCRAVAQLGMTWLCLARGTAWGHHGFGQWRELCFNLRHIKWQYSNFLTNRWCSPADFVAWIGSLGTVWGKPFHIVNSGAFFFWTELNYPIIKLRTGFGNSLQSRPGLIN